jgi:hypothetical protein
MCKYWFNNSDALHVSYVLRGLKQKAIKKTSPAPALVPGPASHYTGFTVRLLRSPLESHSCPFTTVAAAAAGTSAIHSDRLCNLSKALLVAACISS